MSDRRSPRALHPRSAFPVTLVFLMTLSLVEVARPLDPRNRGFRHIWPFLILAGSMGLAFAVRRYRDQ